MATLTALPRHTTLDRAGNPLTFSPMWGGTLYWRQVALEVGFAYHAEEPTHGE